MDIKDLKRIYQILLDKGCGDDDDLPGKFLIYVGTENSPLDEFHNLAYSQMELDVTNARLTQAEIETFENPSITATQNYEHAKELRNRAHRNFKDALNGIKNL